MELKIKLAPGAIMPTYATDGSACFDLYAAGDAYLEDIWHPNAIIPTGLFVEVPPGYVLMIYSRSGHGFKNNVRLANCTGIIDSDYRGEVMVKLTVDFLGVLTVKASDRIAQAMLIPVPKVKFVAVEELSKTQRATGGFGSTGA